MLEEFAMEKKSTNRSAQPPVKGASTESKKVQDNVGTKQFPRSYRKREPNGVNGQKCEPSRKPVPQKNKSFDKRPRQRTQGFDGGKENSKVAVEDVAEYGSVLVSGSKKQNLNHLLNFHYAPREGVAPGSGHWRHGVPGYLRQTHGRWIATYKHKYNKEQFLQANCQFVVKADGNYTSYSSNPDALVEWNLIEQIRLQSGEMLSCPICLYPPVAAKMSRCGHVYCWPCILHYLALSDKTWRKCPICYEAVHKEDLKSVVAIPHPQFSVGAEITLQLMKREKGSLIATPASEFETHSSGRLLSVSETAVDAVYSKLLLATSAEVVPIIDRERKELEIQLDEEKGSPEMCFIEQALELLRQREADVTSKNHQSRQDVAKDASASSVRDTSEAIQPATVCVQKIQAVVYSSAFDDCVVEGASGGEESVVEEGAGVGNHCRYESVSSESFCSDDGAAAAAYDCLQPTSTLSEETQPVKCFYFYQAADGQHIYLHALNVRMLEHCYGGLKDCPPVLRGRILEKESGSMTEELRGRLRYLQHLPVTCQFEVVEIVLQPPVVSRRTLDQFQDQLEVRKRKRQRRAREERRREKHITEEENRRWGRCPIPQIRLESHHQFPLCGSETPQAPATPTGPPSTASSEACSLDSDLLPNISQLVDDVVVVEQPAQSEDVSSTVGSPEPSGFSFAQMLREGRGKVSVGWAVPRRTDKQDAPRHSDSDTEQGGHVPSPSYKLNFCDAIALALEKATPSRQDEQGESAASTGKKKKKQKKPKVLFATGMACPGQ